MHATPTNTGLFLGHTPWGTLHVIPADLQLCLEVSLHESSGRVYSSSWAFTDGIHGSPSPLGLGRVGSVEMETHTHIHPHHPSVLQAAHVKDSPCDIHRVKDEGHATEDEENSGKRPALLNLKTEAREQIGQHWG